jgi:hypothetical protein
MVDTLEFWNNDIQDEQLESECIMPDDDTERDEDDNLNED